MSNIPETISPLSYEHLLPSLEAEQEAYSKEEQQDREKLWPQKSWRKADALETDEALLRQIGFQNPSSGITIFDIRKLLIERWQSREASLLDISDHGSNGDVYAEVMELGETTLKVPYPLYDRLC